MPLKPLPTALGAGGAVVGDQIWRVVAPSTLDMQIPIEHEHVALISLIVGQQFKKLESLATGFGAGLFVVKAFYSDPLGLSDPPLTQQFNLALDALLGGILAMRYFTK